MVHAGVKVIARLLDHAAQRFLARPPPGLIELLGQASAVVLVGKLFGLLMTAVYFDLRNGPSRAKRAISQHFVQHDFRAEKDRNITVVVLDDHTRIALLVSVVVAHCDSTYDL